MLFDFDRSAPFGVAFQHPTREMAYWHTGAGRSAIARLALPSTPSDSRDNCVTHCSSCAARAVNL